MHGMRRIGAGARILRQGVLSICLLSRSGELCVTSADASLLSVIHASLLSVVPSVAEGPGSLGSPYSGAGANNNPEWSKAPDC